jgi:predicted nucleic acid-binding protein
VPITAPVTFRALDAMPRHGLSFWDALIWAAAADNGIPVIYTEDFQDGRNIEGVQFINPFLSGSAPSH